ncbi:hypothetical protein ElyMa_001518200 [Elysia marginata]|uniref:Endonuclease/exonuclease/phosphatase domain-containing protein n=1 Tax=Elysia marginata TaxID=1093978 RepID=A0AAV4JBF7_9GAST|nr:hypothetical protein ElyMa_001518200 [Elysia marginata]
MDWFSIPTQKRGHALDWVIVDKTTPIENLLVIDEGISDHSVIIFNLKMERSKPVKSIIAYRNLNSLDDRNVACDIKKRQRTSSNLILGLCWEHLTPVYEPS